MKRDNEKANEQISIFQQSHFLWIFFILNTGQATAEWMDQILVRLISLVDILSALICLTESLPWRDRQTEGERTEDSYKSVVDKTA